MNRTEQNKKEGRPISDIICGTISVLAGLAFIKVFIYPFSLFFFLGVFFLVGGVVTIKDGYKALRKRNGKAEGKNPPGRTFSLPCFHFHSCRLLRNWRNLRKF
mgnify:CR=1 FL=1